jgi:hypothetical protein
MNNAPSEHRRWFQFRLRTLLVVVTLAAVASWGYWVGRPWWQNYQQQVRFEAAVRQLKTGMTPDAAEALLPVKDDYFLIMQWQSGGMKEAMGRHVLNNSVYCVLYKFDRVADRTTPCVSVLVFRLPHVPRGMAQADGNPDPGVAKDKMDPPPPGGILTEQYFNYFFWFTSVDRKTNPGFEYELIYSDPPAKPVQ